MFICVRILLSFLNHFGLRTYKGQENHQVILTYGRPRMSKKPNPSNQIYHEETDRRISKMTFRLSHLFEISYRCNLYDSIFDLFTFRSCIIADEYFRSLLKLLDTTSILFWSYLKVGDKTKRPRLRLDNGIDSLGKIKHKWVGRSYHFVLFEELYTDSTSEKKGGEKEKTLWRFDFERVGSYRQMSWRQWTESLLRLRT